MKTCTYTTGQVVTFSAPLTLPQPSQSYLTFSITSGGSPCFAWQQSSSQAFSMTTSAGTTSVSATAAGETLTCPNGSSVSASIQQALGDLSCDAGGFGGLPGTVSGSSTGSVSFGILGVTNGTLDIFECATSM